MIIPPRPRDFVQTKENLIFAVVSYDMEDDKIPVFLRYIPSGDKYKKVNTEEANEFLKNNFPEYLFYSKKSDAKLHAVSLQNIKKILRPAERLREILNSNENSLDSVEKKLLKLIKIFNKIIPFDKMGVTGSILIKNQNENSDIDIVIYGIKNFDAARKLVAELINKGNKGEISDLDDELWVDTYKRRDPSISFEEFLWHEKRKFNKAAIDNTKFDIALVREFNEIKQDDKVYKKRGKIKLLARVIDDKFAFDYPARYKIDNEISTVVSFTHTYVGQAKNGELIEISGITEESDGKMRIVVGQARESRDEYIKVVE